MAVGRRPVNCIVVERRPADYTGPVLREFACRSAAEVVGRPVLAADTESAGTD